MEAAFITFMTRGALLADLYEQRVGVAIKIYLVYVLNVTGTLSFMPHFIPAPAEKPGLPAAERFRDGLFVHVSQHQHLVGSTLLYDYGHQPVIIKLEPFKIEAQILSSLRNRVI
jgi:hypothetical protein